MPKEWMLYVEHLAKTPRVARGEITEAEQSHLSGLLLREKKNSKIWIDILGSEIRDAIENWMILGSESDGSLLLDEIKSSVIRRFDNEVKLLIDVALKETQKDAQNLNADE